MATHSSVLAWRIPMERGVGGLQSMGSQRVDALITWLSCTDHETDHAMIM